VDGTKKIDLEDISILKKRKAAFYFFIIVIFENTKHSQIK